MPAVELKTALEAQPPVTEAPVPAIETQAQPASKEEASCCSVQAGKTSHRRYWVTGGAAALGIPLALWGGWDWLVATGLATILIGVAPCLVMCALGLCMARGGKKGEMSLGDIRKTYETSSGEPPSRG